MEENDPQGLDDLARHTFVPSLIILCGATASGKSSLAIAVAQRLHSIIISADSRQVYREFNIGTAKPTPREQNLVPHYLIDLCEPTETLTVAEFQEMATSLIERRKTPDVGAAGCPLLVGGTGLYIKSIVRGMKIPRVAPQPELRSQLQPLGQSHLHALLHQVDPVSARRIHANDQVRTLRALEVFYVTGRPISEQQGETPPTYPILQIGLESHRLDQRIEQRTAQMLDMGFKTEVQMLCEKYGEDLPLLSTLGYSEMKQYLRGDISLDHATQLIGLHTRQFAKRQRTWFRVDPTIEWFDADAPDLLEQVWQRVTQFLQADTK
ncbi:tRNA (adenosine(37)-N6)-dimethylallyltransferase MiaA [Myxacorys almedinensis A]|uniref:tRNA dimethylallyltransferase n=2 Tax=Myxacorys TaxID=2056239 RepID=A0A8J8CGK0_9CYAN|nr:tRNA (adenosine(37)-N6)-dimethylallyltransferase MiaA [Myxacorys almedinensis]NDJ15828.1 tRNA (adenosine(37)-N6)-dimethylallyltransferase MiaA [Myxacorys almedinensis A]